MKNPILSLENVNKSFKTAERTFAALQNVSLEVFPGEYLAIAGKSGSGKSTLLNMITGIDCPDSGKVVVNGKAIGDLNESNLARWRGQHVGIVFQFFQLIPTLTIAENLLLAMEFVKVIPKAERQKRVRHLLDLVDIAGHAHKMPAALSGGEQQRAAIARSMANDPDLIVADEPTGNLDSKTAEAVNLLLKSLAESGKTVVVVTHQTDLESRYDRILRMSDGSLQSPTPTAV